MPRRPLGKPTDGLKGAIALARKEWHAPSFFVPPHLNVRSIREKLDLSQEDFASAFGFTVHQMRLWEQGRSRPLAPVRAYLMIIDQDPAQVLELLHHAVRNKRKIA